MGRDTDADKATGKQPMTFAMVFPVSTHNYEIRYWMGAAGIDPDQDVRLIVIPPPQMVANLKAGNIDGRLQACLFVAPSHELPLRGWLAGLFAAQPLDSVERASLLAGRPGQGQRDSGRMICACFGVGINTLTATIREQRLTTPQAIGAALNAGTNCGSCIPELQRLIAQG